MILDTLEHASHYETLLPGLKTAFDFLRRTDLSSLPDGRIELDGDRIYALLQSYQTKPRQGGQPEAHRRYADVQFILAGHEACGHTTVTGNLSVATPYDATRDFMLFCETACDFITLTPGSFAIFLPHDAHLPGRQDGSEAVAVRKVVVKIRVC